jgi:hypothetical protein
MALRQLGESEAFAAAMRAAGVAEQVVTEPGTVRPVALVTEPGTGLAASDNRAGNRAGGVAMAAHAKGGNHDNRLKSEN